MAIAYLAVAACQRTSPTTRPRAQALTFAITGSAPVIWHMKSQRHRGVRVHGVVKHRFCIHSYRTDFSSIAVSGFVRLLIAALTFWTCSGLISEALLPQLSRM